jgi:hypothetical protein
MNKEIKPIYDETFWIVYQDFQTGPYTHNFALVKIIHFNSLKDALFLETKKMNPYEQQKQIRVYIPERIIQNNNSKILKENLNYIINNKIPFLKFNDDTDTWFINEQILKENIK